MDSLNTLMEIIHAGNLEQVKNYIEVLSHRQNIRPIVESAVCMAFNDGASYEIISWMANRIGTLRVSKTNYGALRLSKNYYKSKY